MDWVTKFNERILDLGGEGKVDDMKGDKVISEPVEYIKVDCQLSINGIPGLIKCVEELEDDHATCDLMKGYPADEEEDLYCSQKTLALIDKIGETNWLLTQI